MTKPEKPVAGDVIDDRFDVIRELGEGGFGVVLEVVDRKSKENYAMKIELAKPSPDDPGLDTEAAILRRMQKKPHILRFVFEGKLRGLTYLVMQLAGSNLSTLRKNCDGRHFSLSTGTRMALQTLDAICVVHECGFLHRDVKPGNFAIGHEGSVRYASINCHNNIDLGRRDDLWSWLYAVIEMHKGKLPWSSVEIEKKVGAIKANTKREDLLKNMESAYQYIYQDMETLKYESKPFYDMYKEELNKVLKQRNIREDEKFDWEMKKINSKSREKIKKIKINKTEFSKSKNAKITKRSKKETHSI